LPDFPNPHQDPGMERRLLLVFALTFLVILVFQPVLKKYLPQPPPKPPAPTTGQNQTTEQSAPAGNPPNAMRKEAPAHNKTTTRVADTQSEAVVENELYKITFTNRGGQVRSWILKKYDDEKGRPLDLVNAVAAEKYGYPLSLWVYDEGLRNKINSALYVTSNSGQQQAPAEITFDYNDNDVEVHKTFRFDHTYTVRVDTSVLAKGNPTSAFPMWPSGFGDQTTQASYASSTVDYQFNSSIERLSAKKISSGNTMKGPFNFAGVADQYFAAVFIPDDPQGAALVTLRNSLDVPKDPQKPNPQDTTKIDVIGTAVGSQVGSTTASLYVGPKTLAVLESVAVPTISGAPQDLRGLVNFGFFGVIARPLFLWLKWTYKYVHNWGWAIVVQTLIINLALLPLRISQMKSALKMQRAAPQIKAIQEKYKKYSMRDPRKQEMNKEVADLYKKEGVNPVGGCLPLIIQMPFLFAYYSMLQAAIDLRHAHWLWVADLSSRDPIFLLPIALVVSMVATQRMTPQPSMDPAQQKMMNVMMPLMMGFIFFNLAAGLNLYYAESNLISIIQQAIMNRTTLGREMREMAQKRARKKDK
jgi:YidC/Oxa1 family membrane protein insertase